MKLKIVIDKLNGFAPNDYQESFDNSGLQIGDVNSEIVKVLVCLDVTEKVINEAISIGANLIVSHHPLIFHGIKYITEKTYIERVIRTAIKNDIVSYKNSSFRHTICEFGLSSLARIFCKLRFLLFCYFNIFVIFLILKSFTHAAAHGNVEIIKSGFRLFMYSVSLGI